MPGADRKYPGAAGARAQAEAAPAAGGMKKGQAPNACPLLSCRQIGRLREIMQAIPPTGEMPQSGKRVLAAAQQLQEGAKHLTRLRRTRLWHCSAALPCPRFGNPPKLALWDIRASAANAESEIAEQLCGLRDFVVTLRGRIF